MSLKDAKAFKSIRIQYIIYSNLNDNEMTNLGVGSIGLSMCLIAIQLNHLFFRIYNLDIGGAIQQLFNILITASLEFYNNF